MCLQPFISPLWVYSFVRIYGCIWIAYSITPFQAGVFWILRRGGFTSAYLCEFNYKCFAQLKSVTAPRAILVIYLWAALAASRNLIGWEQGSSSRWRLQGKRDHWIDNNWPWEVNRKYFFKDHNHVLWSNYRTWKKVRKHMKIMGQSIDHNCAEQLLMAIEGQWSTEAPIVPWLNELCGSLGGAFQD